MCRPVDEPAIKASVFQAYETGIFQVLGAMGQLQQGGFGWRIVN
jgi:hypothetical protein